jgi:hypothetical protein
MWQNSGAKSGGKIMGQKLVIKISQSLHYYKLFPLIFFQSYRNWNKLFPLILFQSYRNWNKLFPLILFQSYRNWN